MMIIWPPPSSQGNVPAFVKFTPWDFSSEISNRSRGIQQFWLNDRSIFLPLPSVIGTNTSMKYSSDLKLVSNAQYDIDRSGDRNTEFVHLTGGLRSPQRRPEGATRPNTPIKPSILPLQVSDTFNENYLDMVDTTWMGMNRRKYAFDFLLICKSIDESETAASISQQFNIYSLSIMSTEALGTTDGTVSIPSGMSRSLHPPMWGISVTEADQSGENDMTRAWIGQYPQLSVLSNIKTFRVGGEDPNSIQGIRLDGIFLPLQYKIQLEFTEIEPVYQSADTNETKSRSQFWTD